MHPTDEPMDPMVGLLCVGSFLIVVVGLVYLVVGSMSRGLAAKRKAKCEQQQGHVLSLIDEMVADPTNAEIRNKLVWVAQRFPDNAHSIYQFALNAVKETKGDPDMKAFALSVGRASYGANRPGGNPTIYDEQAIQNDIASRL